MIGGAVNNLLFLTAFFIFLVGMVGLNFYNTSKVASRVSRLNFVTFVGYVLGLGTVLFFIGTKNPQGLSASFTLKAISIMTLLTWTMCAMILSDMRKDNETKTKGYTFTAWMLGITLLMWIGFTFVGFFTTIGPMMDMADSRLNAGMGMLQQPQMMMMQQPQMMMQQQPQMMMQQQPQMMMQQQPQLPAQFGRRVRSPLLSSSFGRM